MQYAVKPVHFRANNFQKSTVLYKNVTILILNFFIFRYIETESSSKVFFLNEMNKLLFIYKREC